MKLLLLCSLLFSGALLAQKDFYSLKMQTLDGKTYDLTNCKGKKVLVASTSPARLLAGVIACLDSLQKAFPNTTVLAVPATDLGSNFDDSLMNIIRNLKGLHIVISTASPVKKGAGNGQHAIMRWLTHNTDNNHYDADMLTDYQTYIISESGILFSVLQNDAPPNTVADLLKQPDVKK